MSAGQIGKAVVDVTVRIWRELGARLRAPSELPMIHLKNVSHVGCDYKDGPGVPTDASARLMKPRLEGVAIACCHIRAIPVSLRLTNRPVRPHE